MEDDIKYCVTAFIDLLGFSSHLEIGSNDLRTQIGQAAIQRLEFLEYSLTKFEKEVEDSKEFYPEVIYKQRINDGLILMIDLPEFLKPSVGETRKKGLSFNDMNKYFDIENISTDEEFNQQYSKKIDESCFSLSKFVGLISRIHNYVNKEEDLNFFPGAKTVISTGYRKVFKNRKGEEDFLAANFSFSNAYLAEKSLHGPRLYIDCYILHLLCNNKYSRNIIKSAVFIRENKSLDPFENYEDYLMQYPAFKESNTISLILFRKSYTFREIDPRRASYLQITPSFHFFLDNNPSHINKTNLYNSSFKYMNLETVDKERAQKGFFILYSDIDQNIKFLFDLVIYGRSKELENIKNNYKNQNLLSTPNTPNATNTE